ncbi:Cytochrome b reductase 1 [Orchesella cincta]|uniref:Cytochrome b reductase 1 n=1 Tax=Orchesella cincta TaxID=48709 RepID=A0A1D2N4U1_ORCCI|nr:Cytochrome b reductase 1 [Orchesella cincta]
MGSEEDPRDYDFSRKIFKAGFVVAAVSGILMWLLMFVWVFGFTGGVSWGTDSKTEINLHVILMTVFMVYLQGHGAIIFRTLPSRPKFQVKLIHAGFHFTTVIAVSFGLWSAVRAHNMKGQPHFFTLHSWIGIIAIVLFYGQFLAGFLVFLLPYAPMRVRNFVIPYHKFMGPLIFLSSCMAAATGMMMKALGALRY